MKDHARVVVIGGGIVGAAVLYHLTKLGWSDVVLVERRQLTAGSTWHAAGGFHAMNSDPNVARLQAYGISVYREVEEISGQDVGMHVTGGIQVAATEERWENINYEHAKHRVLGIDSHLLTPGEIKKLCPIMDTAGVIGGLFDGNEGHIDPYGSTQALARAARQGGAEVYLNTMVEDLVHRPDGAWTVVTDQGNIHCEHIVNAAGLWAREVGAMAGVHVPIVPMEHHYLLTEQLDELAGWDSELPLVLDLDGEMYLRQEQNGVLLGVYEQNSTPWSVNGTSWDFGETDLLEARLDDVADALTKGFERFPSVAEAGIRRIVNGPFTFAPDGNPLVGPVRGVRNYWSCCGVMAGFSQGSGVALALSQWMIDGEPEGDVFAMDVNRFGAYATSAYAVEKAKEFYENRFYLLCPNDEWPAARPLKTSALHGRLEAANAVFGSSFGLEVPLWFAPEGTEPVEQPSFRRSNSHGPVGDECRAVAGGVGIIDGTSFAKYDVSGPDSAGFLNRLLAGRLPAVGRMRMSPMLSPSGHMKGDLTLMRLADDRFRIIGSGYLQEYHMLWFEQHLGDCNVQLRNRSDELTAISIAGPASRELMQPVADGDFDTAAMPFMSVRTMDVGLAEAQVARVSFTGELGYEIYVPTTFAGAVYDLVLEAGRQFDIRPFGNRALVSMGMEKSFGVWSREFTPDYTPAMCGMDRWIDYAKADFVGREAALADRDGEPEHRLVALEIDAGEADAWGYEPIWLDGDYAGFVTSGAYGHRVGKSLALGYIKSPYLESASSEFSVHLVDGKRQARLLPRPPYDPTASKMRA
ncbi:MAG: FAD-dependent oxidoreductase [Gammaproteobacteria bacterium]|nr:FAD-dependent oxidoreductase [Gammaproteobacteria bacterium]